MVITNHDASATNCLADECSLQTLASVYSPERRSSYLIK